MNIVILGSGCSSGVPRSDGYWGKCNPNNPKNHRMRCSALVQIPHSDLSQNPISILIDTSPDFRQQAINAKISHLDAILWTHDHADQTHGLDDIRSFTFSRGPIDSYMDKVCFDTLTNRFPYIFSGAYEYPPICRPHILDPYPGKITLNIRNSFVEIHTFAQIHGPIQSVGYRIGDFAYSSDISDLPESSFDALTDLKIWVVDALRFRPHPTHAHLEKTLTWIERLKPELAILTNLHQDLDYDELAAILPENIIPAYDLLSIKIT